MPSEPQDIQSETKPITHTLVAVEDGVAYTVVYAFAEPEQHVDEANFQQFYEGVLRSLPNCTVLTEAAAAPPVHDYIGHWYRMDCTAQQGMKISLLGNLYWGKHYSYAVITMFPTGQSDPPDSKRFSQSFTLLNPTK